MNYQGMVGLAASQVWWTAEVEEAFDQAQNHGNMRAMKDFLNKSNNNKSNNSYSNKNNNNIN